MTDSDKLAIAVEALQWIVDCPEQDCERYVARVDAVALAALVSIETGEDVEP